MDSEAVHHLRGRISSAMSFMSLIITNKDESDKVEGQQIPLNLPNRNDNVLEEVGEERAERHEQMGLNLGEVMQNAGQVAIDHRPGVQVPTNLIQDIGNVAPNLPAAIRMLKPALRVFGYRLPNLIPVLDRLREMDQDPANILQKIANALLSQRQKKKLLMDNELQPKPQTPTQEDAQDCEDEAGDCEGEAEVCEDEAEDCEEEEVYSSEHPVEEKCQQVTADTGVQETRHKVDGSEGGGKNEAAVILQEEEDGLSYSSVDEDELQTYIGEQGATVINMNFFVSCPLQKFRDSECAWFGEPCDLKHHVTYSHKNIAFTGNVFTCTALQKTVSLVLYHGEIFLYYKYVSHIGNMYAAVQQVGTTKKKFKYSIELVSDDSVDNINFNFAVTNISVPFEVIFDAGSCMALAEDSLEPFIRNSEIRMIVRLKEVRKRRKPDDKPSSVDLSHTNINIVTQF